MIRKSLHTDFDIWCKSQPTYFIYLLISDDANVKSDDFVVEITLGGKINLWNVRHAPNSFCSLLYNSTIQNIEDIKRSVAN